MVLTAYFGLSSVTGLSCHRRLRDHHLDRLDISVGISGPHDFAVRSGALVSTPPSRPPHPAPNVRDDRDTPLLSRRDVRIDKAVSTKSKSEIFFERGLDATGKSVPQRHCEPTDRANARPMTGSAKQSKKTESCRRFWIASSRCSSQ
jgi:hypothetical protein